MPLFFLHDLYLVNFGSFRSIWINHLVSSSMVLPALVIGFCYMAILPLSSFGGSLGLAVI